MSAVLESLAGAVAGIKVLPLIGALTGVVALAVLIILFKPLLLGLARAALLVLTPRRTKEQLAARRQMRDSQLLQRMINASSGPSHAAELRALSSRS
jgi:hypothetical protein